MCKKSPENCKAKVKCQICKVLLDNQENRDKISLNTVDALLEQQTYIIDIKGDN